MMRTYLRNPQSGMTHLKQLPNSQINLPVQSSPTFSEDINDENGLPPDDEWGEFPDEPKQKT